MQENGHPKVAIYSDADRGTPYTREADQAVHIGGNELATSYPTSERSLLRLERLVQMRSILGLVSYLRTLALPRRYKMLV